MPTSGDSLSQVEEVLKSVEEFQQSSEVSTFTKFHFIGIWKKKKKSVNISI